MSERSQHDGASRELIRFLQERRGLAGTPELLKGKTHKVMSFMELWLHFEKLATFLDFRLVIARHVIVPREVRIDKHIKWIEFDNSEAVLQGFIHPSHRDQQMGIPVVGMRVIGVQKNGSFELGFGATPIP